MKDYTTLSDQLGYKFSDYALLDQALTHSSKSATDNFERLEFLGDRILGFCVASQLYRMYPQESEGVLARRFTNLVRRETLAEIAKSLQLQDHLKLSHNEKKSGGHLKESVLADCCESIIAALFLDGGIEASEAFIKKNWHNYFNRSDLKKKDAKSALQEFVQAQGKAPPRYVVVAQSGSSHDPEYTIEVRVEDYPSQQGIGSSKRAAEQMAAEKLLEIIK